MKKYFLAFFFLLTLALPSFAQSGMTDSQVMDFVLTENEKGTTRQDIVKKLIDRGVSVEQIRRIYQKYQKEKDGSVPGARDISGGKDTSGNRLRKSNSAKATDPRAQRQRQGYRSPAKEVDASDPIYNERQQRLLRNARSSEYMSSLNHMLPDSLDMEDQWMGWYYEDIKENDKQKQVFGRNIFQNKELTFEPELNIAAPADYRLGPGDEVIVDVFGASQESFTCTVSAEGEINVKGYGPIYVDGLSIDAANTRLRQTLGQRYQSSTVRLTVGQTRTISIDVMGEVEYPGTYTVSAFATVFHALYMAGGTNDIGTLRNIKVYRNGREISTCDIYAYILQGNMKGNIRLQSGDVIIVGPYEGIVSIAGKVKRPMRYEMKKNESLATLIQYAGGFTGDAYEDNVRLIRKKGGKMSVYSADPFEQGTLQMMDADSVFVDSVVARYTNSVYLRGAVWHAGMYQMDGSITTVRALVQAAGGLVEDAFPTHALIHRRRADRTTEVIRFDLQGILDHTVADIPLQSEDVVFVPTLYEMRKEQVLKIEGEIVYPGTYDYAENMTIEDFILQAGGLKDAASLVKVDVSRRIRNKRSTTTERKIAEFYSFTIKDGFVIDGDPSFTLEPFDEVYVRRSPGYVEQQHVTIDGEVAFSGQYVLTSKGMRLSDLIEAAGGLTAEAYARGASLERKLTASELLKQKDILRLISGNDSLQVKDKELSDVKTVGIYLDKALAHKGDNRWDIMLQDGDKLVVPQYTNMVNIQGEVMYPNSVSFVKGKGVKYYIDQAGGYNTKAKKSRIFSLNPNGTTTRLRSSKDIEPGATILVPTKPKKTGGMTLAEILSMGSMVATLGMVVATLISK